MVTDLNAEARTNLILPLAGHDLVVGAGDLDAGKEASFVVSIHDSSTVADVGTNRAVVGSLRARETRLRPSEGLHGELVLDLKERVLLFNPKPGLLKHTSLENLLSIISEVCVGRLKR